MTQLMCSKQKLKCSHHNNFLYQSPGYCSSQTYHHGRTGISSREWNDHVNDPSIQSYRTMDLPMYTHLFSYNNYDHWLPLKTCIALRTCIGFFPPVWPWHVVFGFYPLIPIFEEQCEALSYQTSKCWIFDVFSRKCKKKMRNIVKYNFLNFKYFFKIVEDLEKLDHALQKRLRVFLFRATPRERPRQTCGCIEN